MYIEDYEYYKISETLLQFHEIFYKFWTVGKPVFSDKIPTACVVFNKKSGEFLQFLFNPKFWDSLDNYERSYIIAHECLHIILNHGSRSGNDSFSNMVIDLIVNNILTNNLGLKLTPTLEKGCHFSNVFKDSSKINKNRSFEYYYNLLKDQAEQVLVSGEYKNIQDHSYLKELDCDEIIDHIFDIGNEKSNQKKLEEDNEIEKERSKTGSISLDNIYNIKNAYTNKRVKWQQFLKNVVLSKKRKIQRLSNSQNWTKPSKRFNLVKNNILIPNYNNDKPNHKHDMWFFMDISGSCINFADEFFKVAKSIPEKIFDVRFHSFDTSVRQEDLKSGKVHGGGGTAFSPIENFIQKTIKKENIKYPELIVCISDGEGDELKCEKPKNWTWILTSNITRYLPEESNIILYNDL